MEKIIEGHVAVKIGVHGSVSAGVRTAFEMILYELSQQHAADAEKASKNKQRNDELRFTIQSIILAASCLEAFINQEARLVLGQDFEKYDEGSIDVWGNSLNKPRGYPSLENKWLEITQQICNKTFTKTKKPFRKFHELVQSRNEILHYKGKESSAPSPWPETKGLVTEERAKFTAKAARDAVETMQAMLEQFHILTGKKRPVWIK